MTDDVRGYDPIDEQLFAAARTGDAGAVAALLDRHPERLNTRAEPYEWSLLHAAAHQGHGPLVDLLLDRGLDPNTRERGDHTYAMHWAAAAGHLDVVRRLADAGGDVVGSGDDHALEVIGWATCWHGCDDDAHRAIAEFLIGRGARHHIWSAIALDLADEVARIVAADRGALSLRMSRNEDHQLPLHFAVRMRRPRMVALLMELGADPLGVDGSGHAAPAYATAPDIDRPVLDALRAMTAAELVSSGRGGRPPRAGGNDLLAAVALGEWEVAGRLLREVPGLLDGGGSGALHVSAKRNDQAAVRWLLDHDADPDARWSHWGAEVTPLHLAVLGGHPGVTRLLLAAGADPGIRDSMHDSDAMGWAEFFRRTEIQGILAERRKA